MLNIITIFIGKRLFKVGNKDGWKNIFNFTQGDQAQEEERIKSLRILGYYTGSKSTLNKSLKTMLRNGNHKF